MNSCRQPVHHLCIIHFLWDVCGFPWPFCESPMYFPWVSCESPVDHLWASWQIFPILPLDPLWTLVYFSWNTCGTSINYWWISCRFCLCLEWISLICHLKFFIHPHEFPVHVLWICCEFPMGFPRFPVHHLRTSHGFSVSFPCMAYVTPMDFPWAPCGSPVPHLYVHFELLMYSPWISLGIFVDSL